MTVRKSLTLEDDAAGLLERVGNVSAYVSRLVRDSWQQWQHAHALLAAAGWERPELLAACDVLNGYVSSLTSDIPNALRDAQRLDDVCAKWSVSAEHWSTLLAAASADTSGTIARALLELTREFWRGNDYLESLLRVVDAEVAA